MERAISEAIIAQEVQRFTGTPETPEPPVRLVTRAKFNPNLQDTWFIAVSQIINNITMLAIILSGAAVVREREHGTIEHLLVLPLHPSDIMLAKIWSSALVIAVVATLSLRFIVQGMLGVPIAGSVALFMAGTVLYMFAIASLGIFLATIARSMPQFGLLAIPVFLVLNMLSGGTTPLDSMPPMAAGRHAVLPCSPLRELVDGDPVPRRGLRRRLGTLRRGGGNRRGVLRRGACALQADRERSAELNRGSLPEAGILYGCCAALERCGRRRAQPCASMSRRRWRAPNSHSAPAARNITADDHECPSDVLEPVAEQADDDRRYHIAQRVDHQDVEGESGGTHGRVRHVGQDRVGRAGVEEQAEDGQKDQDPDPWERRVQHAEKEREPHQHRRARHQKVRAVEAGAQPVAGEAAEERAAQPGDHGDHAENEGRSGGCAGTRFQVVGHPERDAADGKRHRRHAKRAQHVRRRAQENQVVAPANRRARARA